MTCNVWRVKGGALPLLLTLFSLYPSRLFAAPELLVSSTTLNPGETLRVELDNVSPSDKLKAVFRQHSYAFFPVGPNAQRALIGIALGSPAGDYQLKVRRAGAPSEDLSGLAPIALTIASHTYVVENVNLPPAKNKLVPAENKESARIRRASRTLSSHQYWEGTFIPPVSGPEIAAFGKQRVHNGHEPAGFHNGIDFRAAAGTPVLAANAGIVLFATPFKAHGRTILINHGQGVMTIYLHLQSFAVKPGQHVVKGQKIGRVGSTGVSTGAHVHWQVFVHGVPVDPAQWRDTEF